MSNQEIAGYPTATDGVIVTPVGRVMFESAWEPRPKNPEDPTSALQYGVMLAFPAGADLSLLQQIVTAAAVGKWGADTSKWPANLRSPLRDQGEKADKYQGMVPGAKFINVTSKFPPGIVDQYNRKIIAHEQFYSGCYACVAINAWPYDKSGNRGVALSLQNIQKVRDGERLGGSVPADVQFKAAVAPAGATPPAGATAATAAALFS